MSQRTRGARSGALLGFVGYEIASLLILEAMATPDSVEGASCLRSSGVLLALQLEQSLAGWLAGNRRVEEASQVWLLDSVYHLSLFWVGCFLAEQ